MFTRQNGQGLIEYALILTLVALVVVVVLAVLGPQVGNVFSRVTGGLGIPLAVEEEEEEASSSPLFVSLSAVRSPSGNNVVVTVTVSRSARIYIGEFQSAQLQEITCSATCQVTFTAVGNQAGTVVAYAQGQTRNATYPAR